MDIQQIMYELNNIAKKKSTTIGVCAALGLCGLVIFVVACLSDLDSEDFQTLVIGGAIAVSFLVPFCLVETTRLEKKYKELYKSTLVPIVLSNRLGYVEYYSQCGFSVQSVEEAGLINNMGNSFYSEDYIRGNYQGVNFRQCDINIKLVSKDNEDAQLFFGRVFEFDYIGKNVPELVICTNNYYFHPWIYNYYPVELDSVEFNHRFKVFTMNKESAFYMLTPQMMEKFMLLGQRYDAFALRFTNNRLYVAIQYLNTFEINVSKQLDYNSIMMSFDSDVQTIIDLIYVINCLPKNV